MKTIAPRLLAVVSSVAAMVVMAGSSAADSLDLDLGAVGIGGGASANAAPSAKPAPAASSLAPTTAPLAATQPTSQISGHYIETNVPLTGSYDDIIRVSPSVVAISPNGPGLSEAADLTIRGFADGQYNVTFDGIPFGDADDFTHHTSAYFMAHTLGSVTVDRGPGTASTIGDATFGGSVSLQSRPMAQVAGGAAYTSIGSFNTRLFGAQLNSGTIPALDGGAFSLDVEQLNSDGYLTSSGQQRANVFFKAVQPLGSDTLLTFVTNTQRTQQYQPAGATLAQITTYGPNFALTSDPRQQNFYRYNGEVYHTDFEYLGIQSQVRTGLMLDNKVYTYALYRHFSNGLDVNGETPNGTAFGPDNIPGQKARNDLRAVGDVLRLDATLPFGVLHTGVWLEHQQNSRSQYEVDFSAGAAPNPVLTPAPGIAGSAAVDRAQRETLDTVQPFVEFDWHVTPALTITPGVKFALFDRNVDATVMEGTRQTLRTDATYRAALPAVALHYQLSQTWTAYAQVAKGFLAPPLQFLDVPDPKANPVAPEQTWNYQIGTTWRADHVSVAADGYYIDFINMVGSRTIGSETQVFNEGGVNYLGLEGEATLGLGYGFSVYGNGSLNSARQRSSNAPVPNTPQATLAGGLLYERDAWFGSLIDKWVGGRYGDTGRQQYLAPFNQLDFSAGWQAVGLVKGVPPIKLQLTALNLLDSRKINALAGYTVAATTPLYFTQAGRSLFLGASVLF